MSNSEETFKLLLIGDKRVGKSSILYRYTHHIDHVPKTNLGDDFKVSKIKINKQPITLHI